MRAFSLFLSSLAVLLTFCFNASAEDSDIRTEPTRKHTFQIETPSGGISGILIVSDTDDFIKGSMINEFGVSAIDFSYSKKKQKVKLLNVVSFLNKWYIKLVLKNDLKFCLHVLYGTPFKAKHGYGVTRTGDSVTITNTKRRLRYTFSPLTITATEDETEEQSL